MHYKILQESSHQIFYRKVHLKLFPENRRDNGFIQAASSEHLPNGEKPEMKKELDQFVKNIGPLISYTQLSPYTYELIVFEDHLNPRCCQFYI